MFRHAVPDEARATSLGATLRRLFWVAAIIAAGNRRADTRRSQDNAIYPLW